MLGQLNIAGLDMVEVSIKRLQMFEPEEGYYLAFSGGKDSVCIKALADMAGVKYDAHYSVTSVDPPELVRFVKTFPDVIFEYPRYSDGKVATMWNLIPKKKMPPTRMVRYCCDVLKEQHGKGRFVVTGVRHAESAKRKGRGGLEIGQGRQRERLDPDNPDQEMIHRCQTKSQRILNPIIDWDNDDVWEFIRRYDLKYCSLYDEGFKRLGCIGCPIGEKNNRFREFEYYPRMQNLYVRAFEKMLFERRKNNMETTWKDAEEVMNWWLSQ